MYLCSFMSARHASCLITGYRYICIFNLGWGLFWLLSGYHIPHLFVSLCFVTWDTEVRELSSLTGDQLCCMIDLRGKEYIIFWFFMLTLKMLHWLFLAFCHLFLKCCHTISCVASLTQTSPLINFNRCSQNYSDCSVKYVGNLYLFAYTAKL